MCVNIYCKNCNIMGSSLLPAINNDTKQFRKGVCNHLFDPSSYKFYVLHQCVDTDRIQLGKLASIWSFTKTEWKVVFNDPADPIKYVVLLMEKGIVVVVNFHHILPAWMLLLKVSYQIGVTFFQVLRVFTITTFAFVLFFRNESPIYFRTFNFHKRENMAIIAKKKNNNGQENPANNNGTPQ